MWVVEELAAMALSLRYTVVVSVWRSIVQEVAEAVASSRGTCCVNVVLVTVVAEIERVFKVSVAVLW